MCGNGGDGHADVKARCVRWYYCTVSSSPLHLTWTARHQEEEGEEEEEKKKKS